MPHQVYDTFPVPFSEFDVLFSFSIDAFVLGVTHAQQIFEIFFTPLMDFERGESHNFASRSISLEMFFVGY